jgi:hypothetical protein
MCGLAEPCRLDTAVIRPFLTVTGKDQANALMVHSAQWTCPGCRWIRSAPEL